MSRRFDAIVIGAGQAGPPMVGRIAASGKTVALIERKLIGGTCVNTGCTPTKTLVASAYAAHLARRAADFGVTAGPVGVDFTAVMARKDKVVGASRSGLEAWLKGMANCTLFEGHARFLSPTTVRVGDDVLEADRFFINVGCRPVLPDFPGRDQVRTLTNTTLLELDALPPRLVIVGGSYIGLEFAQSIPPLRLGSHRCGKDAAPDCARGRGRVGRDPRGARSRGHQGSPGGRMHPLRDARRGYRGRRQLRRQASPKSSDRMCCWRSAAGRIQTTSGSRRRASRSMRAGTSLSTMV